MKRPFYQASILLFSCSLSTVSCKAPGSLAVDDSSSVSSISVGDVPNSIITHDKQIIEVSYPNGEKKKYDSRKDDFAKVEFEAGTALTINLALFNEGKLVAASSNKLEKECPPAQLTLNPGENKTRIELCEVDNNGKVVPTAKNQQKIVSSGEKSNLQVEICVKGKNCEDKKMNDPSTPQKIQNTLTAQISEVVQDKAFASPPNFTINTEHTNAGHLDCKLQLEISDLIDFSMTRQIIPSGKKYKQFVFNQGTEDGNSRDILELMNIASQRNMPQIVRLQAFDCKNRNGVSVDDKMVYTESFSNFRTKVRWN